MTHHTKDADLKRKSVVSVLSLFFQSGYSALLGLAANLVLTIFLSPAVFGLYITVLSIISLLNYFSDIGLAASLIQKKEVSDDDIRTTFTVQQVLIITVILIGYSATTFIRSFYNLPQEGVYLYWTLLAAFFISSLKTIPSIFLERDIHFQRIVLVQVVENTVFYISVIICAVMGLGLQSFTISVILRAVTGLVVIYTISPWVPTVGISPASLKRLLSFGVPFQASSFLALFKDDLITLFLGKVLGFEGLGYIGWAKKWAEAPIRIIMDNISRVLFPVIARIQHDKERVGRVVEKMLYYQTATLAPALLGLALIMQTLVTIIPKYNKWEPALPLFYIFCLSAFLSMYSTPFINLFNAVGKAKVSLVFMIIWTGMTWVFTPTLTRLFGLYGFPVTQLLLALTSFLVMLRAKQFISFRFIHAIYKPLIAAAIMGIAVALMLSVSGHSASGVILSVATGALTYVSILQFVFKIDIVQEAKSLFLKT